MCLPGFGTKTTHKNRAAHRGGDDSAGPVGCFLWWAVCCPVYRMQCVPECALFLPYPSQIIGNECTRAHIKMTIILHKTKRAQTVVSQLAHSFNQRARDSSSLERKIPRRIARFLVGFSFFWGSAHFLHTGGKPCFPLHCLHSVHRERFFHTFSGEQQAGELTPLFGIHLSDDCQHHFRGDLRGIRQILFFRCGTGLAADIL